MYEIGEILYENKLTREEDIKEFRLEGEAIISFPKNGMRLENNLSPEEGQKANYIFWLDKNFPGNISIEWDFLPIREPGLAMIWFSAAGMKGEDLFDPSLMKREGEYNQYFGGDMNAYHLSYFRRRYPEERRFHTCNLRKSHGAHLVAQGADPIPDVMDITQPYHIQMVKYEGHICFYIDGLLTLEWHDDNETYGPYLKEGKIGFRQMSPLIAEYSNLVVREVKKIEE